MDIEQPGRLGQDRPSFLFAQKVFVEWRFHMFFFLNHGVPRPIGCSFLPRVEPRRK
jgi:hypothetical protein